MKKQVFVLIGILALCARGAEAQTINASAADQAAIKQTAGWSVRRVQMQGLSGGRVGLDVTLHNMGDSEQVLGRLKALPELVGQQLGVQEPGHGVAQRDAGEAGGR